MRRTKKAVPKKIAWEPLLKAAIAVREHAFAPHSGVKVGAALRSDTGKMFTGCNVESPSIIFHSCAERTAILKAISAGATRFTHCVVVSDFTKPIPPCGYCRQALLEFAPEAVVMMANLRGETAMTTVRDLLPLAYRIEDRVTSSVRRKKKR